VLPSSELKNTFVKKQILLRLQQDYQFKNFGVGLTEPRKVRYLKDSVHRIGVGILIIWTVVPIIWMILTSIKPYRLYSEHPLTLFKPILDNYRVLFIERGAARFIYNTVVVSSVSTLVALILGTLTGYALARSRFKGTTILLLFIILLTRMYPPGSTTIPWYVLVRKVGLYDTLTVLILLYTSLQLPLAILIMRTFFVGLPRELEEYARIDGCSLWQVFTKIALPLSVPGLLSAAIMMFIFSWNHYLFALVLTSSRAKTLPVFTSEFVSDIRVPWTMLTTSGTITILPILIIALMVKKYFVPGITLGAIKE